MVNITMKPNRVTGRERPQETDFNEGRKVVRVLPKNDDIRKYLKHPDTKVGFRSEGSAEWPNDTFTKRRIADGDVRIEQAAAPAQADQQQKAEPKEAEPKAIDKSGAKAANTTEAKPKNE